LLGRVEMRRLYEGQSRDGDGEGVRQWNGRRATREVKRGGGTHTIKALHGSREFIALHSFEKKLGNIFTALFILRRNGRLGLLLFALIVHWTKAIIGVHLLVFSLGMFCFDLPDALFLQWKRAPAVA
jgi:hypothetical protein